MATYNTGYLHNWGLEIPGLNSIPAQITGVLFTGVNAGYNLNAAQSFTTISESSSETAISKNDPGFKFQIYGLGYSKIPIQSVNLTSSFTGVPTGDKFISGKDFTNKLILITKSDGDNLVNSNIGVLSLGKPSGTRFGEYFYPEDTFLDVKKNNLSYAYNDSWLENIDKFTSYNFTGYATDNSPLISTNFFNFKQKLTGDAGVDNWGYSVATNSIGNVIVMGGYTDSGGSGAAIVYTGNSTGGWDFRQKLTGDGGVDNWGTSVATNSSGNVIVVGGRLDNGGSGAAIVYTGNPTQGWGFRSKLTGDGGVDNWGISVATNSSGNVIVVGGWLDSGGSGAAIVYTGSPTAGWTQKSKLTGDGGTDRWGNSVAINSSGNIIVLGGQLDNNSSGAAIVYTGNPTAGWSFRSKLTGDASNINTNDNWGRSIAINSSGDVIVLGGHKDNSQRGAAIVYTGDSTAGWNFRSKLIDNVFPYDLLGENMDQWGTSVAINNNGDIIVLGGPLDNLGGAVIVYTGNPKEGWNTKQKLTGDNGADLWGSSVAINGSGNMVIFAGLEDNSNSGAAIIFQVDNKFYEKDAGLILKDIGGRFLNSNPEYNTYEITYGAKDAFLSGTKVKQNIFLKNLGVDYPNFITQQSLTGGDTKVWASYDVKNGTEQNSKNVFSYGIEIIDKIKTLTDKIIFSNAQSKNEQFSGYRNLLIPILKTGIASSFIKYSGFCFASLECPEIEENILDDIPQFECFTGESIESQEYQIFISGVKRKYKSNELNLRKEYDFASADYLVDKPLLTTFFSIQTGEIVYNSFYTGDTINFSLYGNDYETLYKEYHLGNTPLYPNTGFSLKYPEDFNNIDSLITVLNSKLKNISYPLWYPYECLKGEPSGIYITGGLMSFYKDTGILSGLNFNNIIKFESLRNYPRGFNLSLNLVNRDEFVANFIQSDIKNGFSYLIPDVIELQGFTTGINGSSGWVILDRQSGIYNSLTGLEPRFIPVKSFFDDYKSGILSSEELIEPQEEEENFDLENAFTPGKLELIETFTQNLYSKTSIPEYCGDAERSKTKTIEVYHKRDWPENWTGCPPQPPDSQAQGEDEDEDEGGGGAGSESDLKDSFFLSILRTGWVLNTTGKYLSCLTYPDYTPLSIQFDKYRIVARNLSGIIPLNNEYLIPKNEIYFANLNLFSLKPYSSPQIFTGESKCLVGSNFTGDIQDFVKVPFYQDYQYTISGEDRSGIYKVLNQPVVYTPSTQMRDIKFMNSSGKIVGDITGYLSATFTGTGFITQEFNDKHFYDPVTKEISFQKIITKYVTGSGRITGSEIAIKQNIINQESIFGTRFIANPFYKEIVSNNLVTGQLLNQKYDQQNVLGFYFLTGTISGLSNSGYFNYITGVTGLPSFLDSTNLPYYPIYTGATQASGVINFDFNQVSNFNSVTINNFAVTYHNDTGNFSSPSFFNDVNTLNTIINNNEINFACTSQIINNTGLLLRASNLYAIGDSGNSIPTTSNGSGIFMRQSFLSGGKTLYPILKSIPGDTRMFSGIASNSIAATGFYYELGSGTVLGDINSFSGVRQFSKIWNIKTGENLTLTGLLLESGNKYIGSGVFDVNNILFLNLTYNNELNINDNSSDVVELGVKDNNFITAYNQGYINSGTTGELIFRITGIRNL